MLDAGERRTWIALVPLAVLAALLESSGALLVFGLIGLMTDPAAALSMDGVAWFRGFFPSLGDQAFVSIYAVSVAVFFVLKNLFRLAETYAQQRAASRAAVMMSKRLLDRYLHAPYAFHLSHNSALLIRNTHGSVDQLTRTVLTSATAAMSELFVITGIIFVLALAAPAVTLAAGAFALIVTIPLLRAMQSSYARWGKVLHEKNATLQRRLQEALRGIKEVQVLSGEQYFVEAFSKPRTELAAIQRRTATLQIVPRLAVETFFVMGIVTVFLVALRMDIDSGQLTAYLGLIAYALLRLLPSVHLLVYHLNNIRLGEAAAEQLFADWHMDMASSPDKAPVADAERLNLESAIRFDAVSFQYSGSSEPDLRDINLTIRRGEFFGIVGPTGSGKSTLMDLLLGLHSPSAGRIMIDQHDLAAVRKQWQAGIGYVPQHPFFVDDSIRRNIAFGMPDTLCDDARIRDALERAQLGQFVARLPDGLDTQIGEAGTRLSGGERQRLAIARALYRNPDVLILDEATSALDSQTEAAVAESLQAMRAEMTIIVIAHRLLTIQRCDRLALLHSGRLKDLGTFDELAIRHPEATLAAHSAESDNADTRRD